MCVFQGCRHVAEELISVPAVGLEKLKSTKRLGRPLKWLFEVKTVTGCDFQYLKELLYLEEINISSA